MWYVSTYQEMKCKHFQKDMKCDRSKETFKKENTCNNRVFKHKGMGL